MRKSSSVRYAEWKEWIEKHQHFLKHPADFEARFVLEVLALIPEVTPSNLIPQYKFLDRDGRTRRIDFVILDESRGMGLAIELDGLSKLQDEKSNHIDYDKFRYLLKRQNDLLSMTRDKIFMLFRFANKDWLEKPEYVASQIADELRQEQLVFQEQREKYVGISEEHIAVDEKVIELPRAAWTKGEKNPEKIEKNEREDLMLSRSTGQLVHREKQQKSSLLVALDRDSQIRSGGRKESREIRYSLLTSDSTALDQSGRLEFLLGKGCKILLFCPKGMAGAYSAGRDSFLKARLLQIYECTGEIPSLEVIDGEYGTDYADLCRLSASAEKFNLEQYLVEHGAHCQDMVVKAGAGTGKTSVMVDRIMFLLHTVQDLSMEEIVMITFTNEATKNMKHKIQKVLMDRFSVTSSPVYLKMLEDCSKMRIQTIHSFTKDLINEIGAAVGYGKVVKVASCTYMRLQLIRDLLNEVYGSSRQRVSRELGLTLHELEKLLMEFWSRLDNVAQSDKQIAELDWGEPADEESAGLQRTLKESFSTLYARYRSRRLAEDVMDVRDIIRELAAIIESKEKLSLSAEPAIKYLFVDEFQDSDDVQIRSIVWIRKTIGGRLFVVGDIKQSIYRFRGAVETAFDRLKNELAGNGSVLHEYHLVRNYRTSQDILDQIDPFFTSWARLGLLRYEERLQAQKQYDGVCKLIQVSKNRERKLRQIGELLRELLQSQSGSSDAKIVVLTRTNFQLQRIGQECRRIGVPCYIRQEGTFYESRAVRDFFSMLSAYTFTSSKKWRFNYLMSSFVPLDADAASIVTMIEENHPELADALEKVGWSKYRKALRLRPVLSVLRELVGEAQPHRVYRLKLERMEKNLSKASLEIEEAQYAANIEKLFEILRKSFAGQMASLHSIREFLLTHIQTDRSEDEPDVSELTSAQSCIYGMTVHKAKGLEFDTVVLPFTDRKYRQESMTELLLGKKSQSQKIGWSYVKTDGSSYANSYYAECLREEWNDIDREEARLLYVALTRSIRRLFCCVSGSQPHTWGGLLGDGNV